jgi:hypothetical protein
MINQVFSLLLIVQGATTPIVIDGFQGRAACEWAKNSIVQTDVNAIAVCFTKQDPMHMETKKHG